MPFKFWSMIDFLLAIKWNFHHFFVSVTGKLKFEKKRLFPHLVSPIWYVIVHNHDFLYHMGDTLWGKRQFFSNFSFPVTDTKNWWKYHLMAYKKSIIDQNLKGIAHLKRLPCPWEVWNWNGRGRLNFWATPFKFWKKWYFSKIYKWYYYHF